MKPLIIDNFLDNQSFQNLQNIMFGGEFCWFYLDGIDYRGEEGVKFQFFHTFYKNVEYSILLVMECLMVFSTRSGQKKYIE